MKNWFIYYLAISPLVSLVLMYMGYATTITYIKIGLEILMLLMYVISERKAKELAVRYLNDEKEVILAMMREEDEIEEYILDSHGRYKRKKGN